MSAVTLSSPVYLNQICCTAISEGGFLPIGRRIALGNEAGGVALASANTKYILMGVKIQSGFPTGILDILSVDYVSLTNALSATMEIQLHSTNGNIGSTAGTISFTPADNSISEVFYGDGNQEIVQDGFIISSNYLTQRTSINLNSSEYSLQLTRGQVSQYDTLYIVAIPNKAADIGAKIEIIESS